MAKWSCPRCGVGLVSRGLSHSCGPWSVAGFLEGKGAEGRALYEGFERLIAACGPYELAPAKTRVAFMAEVRFASVNRVGKGSIDIHLVLPRRIKSARFKRVEKLGPVYVHHLRLSSAADLDEELAGWAAASYEEYGKRARLSARPAAAAARPASSRAGRARPRAARRRPS